MITEEDLTEGELAGMEPERRFRFIEQLVAKRLVGERDFNGDQIYDDYDYMSSVLEAARVFGISELLEWEMPHRSGDDWPWRCRNFRAEATRISQRILFEYASRPATDPNTVALNAATKERLRFHLGQMRGIIDREAIPAWKKQDIYEAIAELESEIDKTRTRLAAVLDVVGRAIDGNETVMDAVRKIITIVQEAKAKESSKLTATDEPKRIAPPAASSSEEFTQAYDDESPF